MSAVASEVVAELRPAHVARPVAVKARRPAPNPLTWAPAVSVPCFNRNVVLGSFYSQRAFNEGFARGQIAFNQLMSYLPFVVTSEEFSTIKEVVSNRLTELELEIKNEIDRLDTMLSGEEIKINEHPKKFTSMKEMTVPLYTPEARRLLVLIEKFDDVCWRLEVLRYNEMIKPEVRTSLLNRWKKEIMGLPREMGELWNRARNSLQRKKADRNAERNSRGASKAVVDQLAIPENLEGVLATVDETMKDLAEGSLQAQSTEAELADALLGDASVVDADAVETEQ